MDLEKESEKLKNIRFTEGVEMIVVLSNKKDSHYLYVKEQIEKMGGEIFLLDFSQYPEDIAISLRMDNESANVYFEFDDQKFNGKEIKTVWNRRKSQPAAPKGLIDENVREYIARESQFFLDSLPQILNCFWVSDPDAISLAARKPYQFFKAKELGFKIPQTIISNSQKLTKTFINQINDTIAVKALCMPHVPIPNSEKEALILYTKKKEREELRPLLVNIRNCPTVFQEYVEKEFELRITVVGNQIFPCAIYSQYSERTREDWRRYDLPNTPHKVHELPQDIQMKCLKLVQELDLVFGCIDMIVTPKGEYIFLEINPNGQWLWIERLTGMPIGKTIAEMLINGRII